MGVWRPSPSGVPSQIARTVPSAAVSSWTQLRVFIMIGQPGRTAPSVPTSARTTGLSPWIATYTAPSGPGVISTELVWEPLTGSATGNGVDRGFEVGAAVGPGEPGAAGDSEAGGELLGSKVGKGLGEALGGTPAIPSSLPRS